VDQISDTLNRFDVPHSFIASEYGYNPAAQVHVASVFTAARRLDHIPKPDLIIQDECFVAGTMIGDKRIEDIVTGDMVPSFNEHRRVLTRSRVIAPLKRPAPRYLYKIRSGSTAVICTGNHPFYTDDGWVMARSLKTGDLVYGLRDMRSKYLSEQSAMPVMLQEDNGRQEQGRCAGANEDEQSHEKSRYKSAHGSDSHAYRSFTETLRWQRSATSVAGTAAAITAASPQERSGRCHWPNESTWHGEVLQNRSSDTRTENRSGDRRTVAFVSREEGAGSQEGSVLVVGRLDSIEILEQGSDGEYEKVCPDGYVYNLEVESTHTYIANGFVVHNCHHCTLNSTWGKILGHFKDVLRIGVTATPRRLSGEPLGDLFDSLIIATPMRQLIQQGVLSDYRMYAPTQVVIKDVKTRAGDYAKDQLAGFMDRPSITGDAVTAYRQFASGRRAVAFCVSVAHATHTADAFRAAGFAAAEIDGECAKLDRRRIIQDFRDGRIQVLTSCDLVSEGFDLPAIEVGIFLRPTQSLTIWLQQLGRCLRSMPGKQHAYLLDHASNAQRHGLPDEVREWSLDGKEHRDGRYRPGQ
jgi:hypothetical protein